MAFYMTQSLRLLLQIDAYRVMLSKQKGTVLHLCFQISAVQLRKKPCCVTSRLSAGPATEINTDTQNPAILIGHYSNSKINGVFNKVLM